MTNNPNDTYMQSLVEKAQEAARQAEDAAAKSGLDAATTNNFLKEMQNLKNEQNLKTGGKKKKTKKQWLKLKNKFMKKIMKKIKKNKSMKK